MPQRNADVLEVLIAKMGEYGNINLILGKTLSVLPETYANLSWPDRAS